MAKQRIIETNVGIQEELTTRVFDQFARNMAANTISGDSLFVELPSE